MVATPSTVHTTPNAADLIDLRLEEMERLAESGEWERIERLSKRLPPLLARIPLSERRDILLRTRDCIERVRELAAERSHEIGERLATLKTGRQAAESYRATSAMSNDTRF